MEKKGLILLLALAVGGCGMNAANTAQTINTQYAAAVSALNAYCQAVGTSDPEIEAICIKVTSVANPTLPLIQDAITAIVGLLGKRSAELNRSICLEHH